MSSEVNKAKQSKVVSGYQCYQLLIGQLSLEEKKIKTRIGGEELWVCCVTFVANDGDEEGKRGEKKNYSER